MQNQVSALETSKQNLQLQKAESEHSQRGKLEKKLWKLQISTLLI